MHNQLSRQQYMRRKAKTRMPGPIIPGYRIEYQPDSRLVFINQLMFKCSPTQFKLLQFILCHYNQALTYEQLIALFDPFALDHPELLDPARRKLVKMISELRVKMWESGLTIFSQYGLGYLLQNQPGYPCFVPPEETLLLRKTGQNVDQLS